MPYGIYDVAANAAFVSVGITSDMAEFAVEAIRSWLGRMGRTLSESARADDHSGLRRLERRARAALEG